MNPKTFNKLLLFSLFGLSLWFFGNLYEAVVIAPNLLTHTTQKIQNWRQFFSVTNPLFFYIPLAPLAVVALPVVYRKTNPAESTLKRHLKIASIFGLLALGLGIYIISQINLKLFFGATNQSANEVYRLSLLWNILNVVRVAFLGVTVYHVFKGYVYIRTSA